jgi:phosphoenolpyruvate-protein kinase (PTS system EI component)
VARRYFEAAESVVEGIAIGSAILWKGDPPPHARVGTVEEERSRLMRAIARATSGVRELARRLPPAEAELFEPEVSILAELAPEMLAKVGAGARPEEVVAAATSALVNDLLDDARARLLDGLARDERSVEGMLSGREGDWLLIAETLTPSVVASLPSHVVGIVAAADAAEATVGTTSHAAILARTRDIPMALAQRRVVQSIREGEAVVLDTTTRPVSLWLAPPPHRMLAARARREAWTHKRGEVEAEVAAPLAHLGVNVHVNVGSVDERLPSSIEGIGLVRTELLFLDHTKIPSEAEQFGALRSLAARVGDVPLTVRLFDVGGDKTVPWLPTPPGSAHRGTELLLSHPEVLESQVRAIVRAGAHARIRVLLPLVTGASQVAHVRARMHGLPIGAMIETPEAVGRIDEISLSADFIAIGTNDLSAALTGQSRASSILSFDQRLLRSIARVVEAAHARQRVVSVCGEMAGDPQGARLLVGLGVDTLSVATGRLASVKVSLREVSIEDCRSVLHETLA